MLHSPFGIEAMTDDAEKAIVVMFERTKNGVADQIRELNETRRLRIQEDRYFGEIPGQSKGVTGVFEFTCQRLDARFHG